MGKEIPEKERSKLRLNLQINYKIIQAMWKYCNKRGNIGMLYGMMGISKNTYSHIRAGDVVSIERLWEKKGRNEGLSCLGLSKNTMFGKTRLEVAGIEENDWKKYLDACYLDSAYNMDEKLTAKDAENFKIYIDMKLKEAFRGIESGESQMGRLYHFCRYKQKWDAKDGQMGVLKDALQGLGKEEMMECRNNKLMQEVLGLLKDRLEKLEVIVEYNKMKEEQN